MSSPSTIYMLSKPSFEYFYSENKMLIHILLLRCCFCKICSLRLEFKDTKTWIDGNSTSVTIPFDAPSARGPYIKCSHSFSGFPPAHKMTSLLLNEAICYAYWKTRPPPIAARALYMAPNGKKSAFSPCVICIFYSQLFSQTVEGARTFIKACLLKASLKK